MSSLHWTQDGVTLSLQGELDQDYLVPLWESREEATRGIEVIDLSAVTRVDTAGIALLMHLVAYIRAGGRAVSITGKSEKMNTLIQLYNLPAALIP